MKIRSKKSDKSLKNFGDNVRIWNTFRNVQFTVADTIYGVTHKTLASRLVATLANKMYIYGRSHKTDI